MSTITKHKPRKIADQVEDLMATEFVKGTRKPRTISDFRALFFPNTDPLEARYIWNQVKNHIKNDIRKSDGLIGGVPVELSGQRTIEDARLWQWEFTQRASETTEVTRHAQRCKRGIDIHNSSRGHNLIATKMIGSLEDKKILDRYRDLLGVAEHFETKAINAMGLIVDGETDSAADAA